MRFDRLDLIRYGALTDRVMDFRPDAGLHLIYGPNEAGKSSALKAISDLLFGFPHSTDAGFLHDQKTLRVGARIAAGNGRLLNFRRRKGAKTTLLSDDDKEMALAEDVLAPYLGNMSRDVFERAFGLDSVRLRQGARDMLKSGGEIGSLLFSAASGLTGLTRLRQSIDTEADGIFTARRSKDRVFYQALDRHKAALDDERQNELRSNDWKKLVVETTGLEAELAALQSARHDTRQLLDRLRRLKTLQPLLLEIDGEEAALEGSADLGRLPQGFEQQLADALAGSRAGNDALHAAQAEVARIREELEAAHVDGGILDASGEIMSCHADKGNYLSLRRDLPAVKREVKDFELRLAQFGRKLGLPDDVAEIERRQPPDAVLAHLGALLREGRDLKRAEDAIHAQLDEQHRQLRRLEAGSTAGRLIDPKPYADQLAALQPDIAELARVDQLQVRVSRARADIDEAVGRLSPAVLDLDRLLAVPLPDTPTLDVHRRVIEEASAVERMATTDLAALERKQTEIARDLAALEREGKIASREEVVAARARRDGLLRQLEEAQPQGRAEHLAPLGAAIGEADRLADLALADAERVSRHAQMKLQSGEVERAIVGARTERDAAGRVLAQAQADFTALFATAGITPDSAERMIDWRRAIDALARQREALHGLEGELAALRFAESRIAPALVALAEATGLAGAASLPLQPMARALQRHIGEIAERWTESRSAEGKRATIAEAVAGLEQRQGELAADIARWRAEFADAALAVGLTDDASMEMAEAVLDLWKAVPQTLFERENRQHRVDGIQRDMASFEDRVRKLVDDIAPDLASQAVEVAVDLLHRRAMAANAAQERRQTLLEARERAGHRLSHWASEAQEAQARLALMLEQVPEAADPDLLLQRLRERRGLESRLSACRTRFQQQSEGSGEDEIRILLKDFDRVAADLEIERLAAEDASQVARYGELTAASAENLRKRQALETGVSAEYAALEKLAAEEEAKDLARQWVVLKIAGRMLAGTMEAYRERQTDPVMARAGAIFSVLTGGRFARLVEDYGDDDTLQLMAERAGGERVPLDGLSEGTGDQLYLALRLAFLEDYSVRNEPAPLIVDDIFQTFDDERAAAGLRALAATGDRLQTILFTHETSIVEIARSEIGPGLDLIRL